MQNIKYEFINHFFYFNSIFGSVQFLWKCEHTKNCTFYCFFSYLFMLLPYRCMGCGHPWVQVSVLLLHVTMPGLPHAGSNGPTAGHGWVQQPRWWCLSSGTAWGRKEGTVLPGSQHKERKRDKQPCRHLGERRRRAGGSPGAGAKTPCGPWAGGRAGADGKKYRLWRACAGAHFIFF